MKRNKHNLYVRPNAALCTPVAPSVGGMLAFGLGRNPQFVSWGLLATFHPPQFWQAALRSAAGSGLLLDDSAKKDGTAAIK